MSRSNTDLHLAATCVSLGSEYGYEIIAYIKNHGRKVTYRTFSDNVGEGKQDFEESAGFRLSDKWFYGYYKSKLPSGIPIYYLAWSGVEHIFTESGKINVGKEGALAKKWFSSSLMGLGDEGYPLEKSMAWMWGAIGVATGVAIGYAVRGDGASKP